MNGHPLKGVKQELQAHGQCRELVLGYLPTGAVTEYLNRRFGRYHFPAALRGLLLVGGAWIAIGLLASSLTSNQIVAAVVGIGLLLVLYVAFSFLPLPQPYSDFFEYVNASTHAQSFHSGRLVLSDLVYFVTVIAAALFGATRVLESRRWR